MNGFRGRANEDLLEFLFPVVVIIGDGDLGCMLSKRAECLKRFLEVVVKTATDHAGPTNVERLLLGIEANTRLFPLDAVRFGNGLDLKVIQPSTERSLDLG